MRPLLLAGLALPALAFAQGALTPPADAFLNGAPAATMKTLDQLEPRIPLKAGAPGVSYDSSSGGFTIGSSGSYYLTDNLTVKGGNAIRITGSDVTLDLGGYSIRSNAKIPVGIAIEVQGGSDEIRNVQIRNGHIGPPLAYNTPSGFVTGVRGGINTTVTVLDLTVFRTTGGAIELESHHSLVERCTVTDCGTGIAASTVRACVVSTKGVAITALTIADCQAGSTNDTAVTAAVATNTSGSSTYGIGLRATQSADNCFGETFYGACGLIVATTEDPAVQGSAANCRGLCHSTGIGLLAGAALNCTGTSNSGIGLVTETATGCRGTSASGIGLRATQTATGSVGRTESGTCALNVGAEGGAGGTAENCRGINTGSGTGLWAECATNCFGESASGTGLSASTANNCSAYSASGTPAMSVAGTANGCRGNTSKADGVAIQCTIALGCTAAGGSIVGNKQLGTP